MTSQRRTIFDFIEAAAHRLEKGQISYGDRSFSREPLELLTEIEEEVLDVCTWSWILYCRLDTIRAALTETPPPPNKLQLEVVPSRSESKLASLVRRAGERPSEDEPR